MLKIIDKFSSSTRRVTFGLSIIKLAKAFLSFFTVIISSTYFGTSLGRDVWLLSLSIISILGAVLFGPVFEIFRAKFVMIKEIEGENIALKSTYSLLFYMFSISLLLIILTEGLPSILGNAFAPTYNDEQQRELSIMIRLIAPTLLFSIFVSILTGLLNVYKVFYVPEIMNIFTSLLNVIIILLFAPGYGIYSLVLSNYLSNILLIIVLLVVIRKNAIRLFQNVSLNIKYTYTFFKFAIPFYFNYVIAQVLLAAERIISTLLGIGSLSVLDYARKFVSIPISVIQSTINTVLTANLTEIYIKNGEISFIKELTKFLDMMVLVTLPLVTIFIVCPVEIVRIFLLRGAFEPKFLIPTANSLFWFGFGIVSIIFYSTNSQALLSQGKNKVSALISGTMGFLVLAINLLFYRKYGIQVLAFSWSIVHFISGVLMYFVISFGEFKQLLVEFVRKISLIIIVVAISTGLHYILKQFVSLENDILKSFIVLGLVGFFASILELVLVYFMGFKEQLVITKYLRKYLFKRV